MKKNSSSFKIEKIIGLPIFVETHAILMDWNGELWIFINAAENKETFAFKLNASFAFEKITTLPLLSTSAIVCEKMIIISGANADGNPMVVAIDNSGKIQYKNLLNITPIIWPVLSFNKEVFIAWQENQNEIERGILNLKTNKIEKFPAILVEKPPVILFPLKETLLATITKNNKINIVDLHNGKTVAEDILQQVSIGKAQEGVFYGWLEGNKICIKQHINDESDCIPLKNASLGNLKAISGNEVTLWIQNRELTIDGNYQWKSTIIQENTDLFEIEGFVYSVISLEKRFVAIQNSKLILFKK